ncbi:hypothetical protein FRC01_011568 [Tulasnella sp. 417]|nr:hypothetical protein FRC01_011568 [Tulasnella sp. 417]
MATPLDTLKQLAKSVVDRSPEIAMTTSKSTYPYTPSAPMPELAICLIQLSFDPHLPQTLLDALDVFLAGLNAQDLNLQCLRVAAIYVPICIRQTLQQTLSDESSVQDSLQEFPNVQPDKSMIVNGKNVVIFEHESPADAARYFPDIIQLGMQRGQLDLSKSATHASSILSKIALALLSVGLEYGVIHSAESYIFLRIVRDPRGRYNMMISRIIRLTDSDTPIIPLILSLILHTRRDGHGLPSLPFEIPTTDAEDSQPALIRSAADGEDNGDDLCPVSHDCDHMLRPFAIHWIPDNLDEPTLAELLETILSPFAGSSALIQKISGLRLAKNIPPFGQYLAFLIRRTCSLNTWHKTNLHPRRHFSHSCFKLCSNVGKGAKGWAFRGTITGLPDIQLIAKLLFVDDMLQELDTWRKLRSLAGIRIPGLYGAYVLDDPCQSRQRGLLLQQDAGHSIVSYESLCLEQKQELYHAALELHRAGIIHNDIMPPNVTVADDGRVMIIDFDQAEDHECPGEMECAELHYLKSELGLPSVCEEPKP